MGAAPALPEAAFSVALIIYIIGWGVALGLAFIWLHTFHELFAGIAKALTFKVSLGWGPSKTIHLGGWANTIDHAALQLFTNWAAENEVAVGKTWHAMGTMFWAMSHAISDAAAATLEAGHWIVHDYVPGRIKADLEPLWNKSNKTAAAVAAAAAGLAYLKHSTDAHNRAQAQTNKVAKAHTKDAQETATDARSRVATVEQTAHAHAKTMTAVLDIPALPVPFGRTAKQLWRLARKHEAIIGATVFAAAMANVLGLPNPRCLTKGPLGRFARTLCGIPTHWLNDLLGLLADFFILENVCTVLPWLEAGASDIAVPLVEVLTDITAGLCKGSIGAAKPLQGPKPVAPPFMYVSPLAV